MRQRHYTYLLLLAAVLTVAACSTDGDAGGATDGGRIAIEVRADVVGATRGTSASHLNATGTQFTAGTLVDLFVTQSALPTGSSTATDYNGRKQNLKADGSGGFTWHATTDNDRTGAHVPHYWPSQGNSLTFYAYYPANKVTGPITSASGSQELSVATDQGAADAAEKEDLLFGKPAANPVFSPIITQETYATTPSRSGVVPLTFTHSLSKVVVRIKPDGSSIGNGTAGGPTTGDHVNGYGYDTFGHDLFTDATLTLGSSDMQDHYSLALTTGEATATGSANQTFTLKKSTDPVPATDGGYQTYYCIIPPGQALSDKQITLALSTGIKVKYTIPGDITAAAAGTVYTYSLTVGLYELTATNTITDWEGVETGVNDQPFVIHE